MILLQTADASQPKAIRMAGSSENESCPAAYDEPAFFSILDIALIVCLFLGAAWWLLRKKKQEDLTPATKSYTIQ